MNNPDLLAQVSPNPARGMLTVNTSFTGPEFVLATLVNGLGQEMRKQVFATAGGWFSLEGVAAGVYFLQLRSGEQSVVKKIVVE